MLAPPVRRLLESVPFVLPLLLLLPEGAYVPIFDGREYATCIVRMASTPSLDNLACAAHPTHAYVLVTAAVQAIHPGSSFLLLLGHLIFLLAALFAFRRIVAHLFPDPDGWLDRVCVVSALAVNPLLLACTLQPNPDTAALAGALFTIEAILAKRIVRATLAGLFLVFTKEVGLLFFVAIVLVYAVVFVTRSDEALREKRRALLRLWPLGLPLVAAGARLALMRLPPHVGKAPSVLSEFLSVQLLDKVFLSYAAGITVLQFQWMQTLVLVAFAVVVAARWAFARPIFTDTAHAKAIAFAFVVFALFFFVTTRYRAYSSPRYWVAVYPVMTLATYAALREFRLPASARRGFFGLLCVGYLASESHAADPISRKVYGTFSFGEHTMLRTASITNFAGDAATGGGDALPYNLQFANLHYLQNAILSTLDPAIPLLVDTQADWHLWDTIGPDRRRTLDPKGVVLPAYRAIGSGPTFKLIEWEPYEYSTGSPASVKSVPPTIALPRDLVYVVYPMFATFQRRVLGDLRRAYVISPPVSVDHDGYRAEVYRLTFDEDRWRERNQAPSGTAAP